MGLAFLDPQGEFCLPRSKTEMLIVCWQAFLKQAERDDNVRTLLLAIRDAFDFAQLENVLRGVKAGSKQALIMMDMLKEVQVCGEFIQQYANDLQLCTSPPHFVDDYTFVNVQQNGP